MLGAVVGPTEISLMWQAVSVSGRLPGTPYECLWADLSQYAWLVNALDVLLFPRGYGRILRNRIAVQALVLRLEYIILSSFVQKSFGVWEDKLHITMVL